jgi:activator of 2-hydroxyglutaryl-CoA dehydratase
LKTIMEEKFNAEVVIPGNPQFMSALGAAALAKSFEDEVKKEKKVFNNV